MEVNISKLVELQVIDSKIIQLDKDMTEGYAELDGRKADIKERKAAIEQLTLKLESSKAQQRELEMGLEVAQRVEQRMSELETKLGGRERLN